MTAPSTAHRMIVQLAAGKDLTQAAADCGLKSKDALAIAHDAGWPDLDAVHATAATLTPGDDVSPKAVEPVPPEPDADAAVTAGAAQIAEERASVVVDAALATSVQARDTAADRAVDEYTLQRLLWQDTPLIVQQAARAHAIREVCDLTSAADPGASASDLIDLADYIVTGRWPLNPGGER